MKKKKHIEEIFNSASHGIAAIISIIGLVVLINNSSKKELMLFSAIVYGISLIVLYTSSSLYHAFRNKKIKHVFRILDHCSIYFLIAGTYTPILLILIGGSIGWWIFGIQWTLVLIGFIFKIFYTGKYESISVLIYLLMGWMVVFKWDYLTNAIYDSAFNLLLAGGIVYTIGIFFYLLDSKIRYFHFLWHLFVITGSALHYTLIFKYVLN